MKIEGESERKSKSEKGTGIERKRTPEKRAR